MQTTSPGSLASVSSEPAPSGPDIVRNGTALFLDFDGCLVDLADAPEEIVVSPGLPALLTRVQQALQGRVALISGRNVVNLRDHLPQFDGPIYGSHGAELFHDGTLSQLADPSALIAGFKDHAEAFCASHDGLLFEPKPMGLTIHFRDCPEKAPLVRDFLEAQSARTPELILQDAKLALELRPLAATKGNALRDALDRFGWRGHTPVHIGDDVTDEDAFRAAATLGGFGIKVGKGDTVAPYHVARPAMVHALLARWADHRDD